MKPWERYEPAVGASAPAAPSAPASGPWARYAESQAPSRPTYSNPIKPLQQGLYAGMADILGAPVDLASSLTGEEDPFGGSRSIRRGMNKLPLPSGASVTYEQIDDVPQEWRPLARAGEVVGAASPIAAAPFAAKRAASELPRVVRPVVEAARNTPRQFMATEAATTAGAAQGAAIAEMVSPGETIPRVVGEIAGGVVNPLGLVVRGVAGGMRSARDALRTMTPAGRRDRASQVLRQALEQSGEDPAALAKALRDADLDGVNLTSGQKTGSPTLLAFEAQLATKSPEFGNVAKKRALDSMGALRQLIGRMQESGDPELLRAAANMRQSYFNDLIASRLSVARREADDANRHVERMAGDKEAASIRAHQILDDAMRSARQVEHELWERIPRDVRMAPQGITQAFDRIRANMLPEEPLPPAFIGQFAERVGRDGFVTSGDLLRFRSQMLSRARDARAKGDFAEARQYSQMADGAMADLDTIDLPQAAEARQWSRAMHDAFTRTYAGDALATRGSGEGRIAPEMMLEKAFRGGGTGASLRLRQLQDAAAFPGDRPGMMSEQEEFLRAAAGAALDPQSGRINPRSLETFLRNNQSTLERFPALRSQLSDASRAETAFRDLDASARTATKAIRDRSAFARVLADESPSAAVRTAMRSGNPTGDYMALVRLARRGPEGAVGGLKGSTLDHAVSQATDATGNFSFKRFSEALNRPLTERGQSLLQIMDQQGVMVKNEAARLNAIVKRAEQVESAVGSGHRMSSIVGDPDALTDLVLRIVGANVGGSSVVGQASGASLVTAGATSRALRRVFERVPNTRLHVVLEEAAKDPKFMAALIERPSTPKRAGELHRQINAFLLQAGLVPNERQERIDAIPK